MDSKQTRTLLIFYILAFYIVLQFCWWAYYLVDLNAQIRDLKILSLESGSDSSGVVLSYEKKNWMILGEGMVFILFLSIGIWKVQKNIKQEAKIIQLQQNFLLSVTHELKSPIASLKLYMQTLLKRSLPLEKQQELLERSGEDADRLDLLTDKILLAARMESSDQALHMVELDIDEVISATSTHLSEAIGKHHVTEINCYSNATVFADPQGIRSIVANLYENAVKYSDKGSKIGVLCKKEGGAVVVSVSDEGQGIEQGDYNNIFLKFYRSGSENTRTTKGTGLGLYIVKQLAELHGASISIKSNSPKGSIFTLKFKI